MDNKIVIDIGNNFAKDLNYESANQFLEENLLPMLKLDRAVEVILDNTNGYSSSWLENVFSNIPDEHKWQLLFITEDDSLEMEIREYMSQ